MENKEKNFKGLKVKEYGNSKTDVYYEPTGEFSVSFILYFILVQMIAIPIIGFCYAHLMYQVSYLLTKLLCVVSCGVMAGLAMRLIIILSKLKNSKIALVFGVLAVCTTKYVYLCVYTLIVLTESYGMLYIDSMSDFILLSADLAVHPSNLLYFISIIIQEGVWSINGTLHNGGLLLFDWIAEFIILTAVSCVVFMSKYRFKLNVKQN